MAGGAKSRTPKQSIPSRWVKCISTHGRIRGVAIQATSLAQETCVRHKLHGDAARGMGEALMGSLLIASYCKEGERVNLNIQGDAGFRQALVEAKPDGTARGYLIERDPTSFVANPAFGPWGGGTLSVLRTRDREREQPYIGTVPLLTGHLAKDLTFYWAQSEQVPSAVGLAVVVRDDVIVSAGGFLIQIMPGATAEEVRTVETHINEIQSLAEQLGESGGDPLALLGQIFQSTAFVLLEEKELGFFCNCSMERAHRALSLIGPSELQAILREEDHASVHCDFCAKEYRVGREELEKLIAAASSETPPETPA